MQRLPAPRSLLAPLVLAFAAASASAQVRVRQAPAPDAHDPAVAFLAPYGLEHFHPQTVTALSAFLRARQSFEVGRYGEAQGILDALWAQHPVGATSWGNLPTQTLGLNLGVPPAYYGLRMLTDATDWHVAHPGAGPALRTARLTVLLVGHSSGVEPRSLAELLQGTGVQVEHALDPLLLADGSAVVHRSLRLFQDYVLAMTGGALAIETRVVHLPEVSLPVQASALSLGLYTASPADASQVWPSVPDEVREETDWWWLIYPSHVPEQYPDFQDAEFITGGMGAGAHSASPLFLIDDRWLVRKPPHLGDGPYSAVEREVYLPQWLQHEFFHHLFRTYPQLGLETTPHQWFDLGTWPADFVGRYEADYYHEALVKRLQGATPPLVAGLRYSTVGAPWEAFQIADLIGAYQRSPVQNPWHVGAIQLSPQLEWQNLAGVDWNLQDDLAHGRLLTGPDCPYFGSWSGKRFELVLERDALGDLTPALRGFAFNGELYARLGP